MARAKKTLEKSKNKESYAKMSGAEKKSAVSKIADLIRRRQSKPASGFKTSAGERKAWGNNRPSSTGAAKRRGVSKMWSSDKKKTSTTRKTTQSTRDRVKNYKKSSGVSKKRRVPWGSRDLNPGVKQYGVGVEWYKDSTPAKKRIVAKRPYQTKKKKK